MSSEPEPAAASDAASGGGGEAFFLPPLTATVLELSFLGLFVPASSSLSESESVLLKISIVFLFLAFFFGFSCCCTAAAAPPLDADDVEAPVAAVVDRDAPLFRPTGFLLLPSSSLSLLSAIPMELGCTQQHQQQVQEPSQINAHTASQKDVNKGTYWILIIAFDDDEAFLLPAEAEDEDWGGVREEELCC
jgi:hypothetical protein